MSPEALQCHARDMAQAQTFDSAPSLTLRMLRSFSFSDATGVLMLHREARLRRRLVQLITLARDETEQPACGEPTGLAAGCGAARVGTSH
eukprot:6200874-Pleurochrysis_carterae.AAC.2